MSVRVLLAAVMCVVTLDGRAVHGDQSAPPQPGSQTFGTGTTAIVVDVVVRDRKGNPVTDLHKADFELLEDSVPQTLGDLTLRRAQSARAIRDDGRTTCATRSAVLFARTGHSAHVCAKRASRID
jgi:hypothetical protein